MADIKKPISITDKVLKEGSGEVNKLVRVKHTRPRLVVRWRCSGALDAILIARIVYLVRRRLQTCAKFLHHAGRAHY